MVTSRRTVGCINNSSSHDMYLEQSEWAESTMMAPKHTYLDTSAFALDTALARLCASQLGHAARPAAHMTIELIVRVSSVDIITCHARRFMTLRTSSCSARERQKPRV